MKKSITYMLILLLASCAKEADWQVDEIKENKIVVEAVITNETGRQCIMLSHSTGYMNEEPLPLSGAEVYISNEDSTWRFTEEASPGEGWYTSETDIAASYDKNYSLLILFKDHVFSAQTYMAQGKFFTELTYTRNPASDLYHISYVASSFQEEDPAMWEIMLDWSSVPGYENEDPENCRKKLLFYTLSTLDVSQVFAPLVEEVWFPAGTRIDQRRYSLTPEHEAFIRSLLLETSWQGGIFPSDPANIGSNISGGALGFFAVCAVNSLSIIVE